jgi:hypothetical protein
MDSGAFDTRPEDMTSSPLPRSFDSGNRVTLNADVGTPYWNLHLCDGLTILLYDSRGLHYFNTKAANIYEQFSDRKEQQELHRARKNGAAKF